MFFPDFGIFFKKAMAMALIVQILKKYIWTEPMSTAIIIFKKIHKMLKNKKVRWKKLKIQKYRSKNRPFWRFKLFFLTYTTSPKIGIF